MRVGVVSMKIRTTADLARIIKTRRILLDRTQHHVAEEVGISRQSYSKIEHGSGGTSIDTILRILHHLDITLDGSWFDPTGDHEQPEAPTRPAPFNVFIPGADPAKTARPNPLLEALTRRELRIANAHGLTSPTAEEGISRPPTRRERREALLAALQAKVESSDPDQVAASQEQDGDQDGR